MDAKRAKRKPTQPHSLSEAHGKLVELLAQIAIDEFFGEHEPALTPPEELQEEAQQP